MTKITGSNMKKSFIALGISILVFAICAGIYHFISLEKKPKALTPREKPMWIKPSPFFLQT